MLVNLIFIDKNKEGVELGEIGRVQINKDGLLEVMEEVFNYLFFYDKDCTWVPKKIVEFEDNRRFEVCDLAFHHCFAKGHLSISDLVKIHLLHMKL